MGLESDCCYKDEEPQTLIPQVNVLSTATILKARRLRNELNMRYNTRRRSYFYNYISIFYEVTKVISGLSLDNIRTFSSVKSERNHLNRGVLRTNLISDICGNLIASFVLIFT